MTRKSVVSDLLPAALGPYSHTQLRAQPGIVSRSAVSVHPC
jgi:hypothetical protein